MSNKVMPVKNCLISVSDKTDLEDLAYGLIEHGARIIASQGTYKKLQKANIKATSVEELYGFSEIIGGRIKTIHPNIHAGLLARENLKSDMDDLKSINAPKIDLAVVNLYPFEMVMENTHADQIETLVDNIDVGGAAMIRSAAKNFEHVTVLVDPSDYLQALQLLGSKNGFDLADRRVLACRAFSYLTKYNALVTDWLANKQDLSSTKIFTSTIGNAGLSLSYGENKHQKAHFYSTYQKSPGVANAKIVKGSALSYNNLVDADSAFEMVSEMARFGNAVVIFKHDNPCGAAISNNLLDAYKLAYDSNPTSAFGGIVAASETVDLDTAKEIKKHFTELLIAPKIDKEALDILSKKKNLRIFASGQLAQGASAKNLQIKTITGGLLIQNTDQVILEKNDLKLVTHLKAKDEMMDSILIGEIICKYAKSNSIVFVSGTQLVGLGCGMTNRVDAAKYAADKVLERKTKVDPSSLVCASDGFLPFPDTLEQLQRVGCKVLIQPGGSKNDALAVKRANELGITMYFSGIRRFRH